MRFETKHMKRDFHVRFISLAFAAIMLSVKAFAGTPTVQVQVTLTPISGDPVVLTNDNTDADDEFNAPLHARFASSLSSDDGREDELRSQWTIRLLPGDESADTIDYLKRYENVTEYEFTDYGSFQVVYEWSYRDKDSANFVLGNKLKLRFNIDESVVRLDYNGFSPNDDGINDVFKIYARSVVRMNISIFNRWGQLIKNISGPMESILPSDAVADENGGYLFEVWDGKHNGRVVNDGVYYINVQATGAGGKKYDLKKDINVLKGQGN